MKKTPYLLLLIFCLLSICELNAQNAKKLIGTWSRVARKGNDACQVDHQFVLREDGTATVRYGHMFDACEKKYEEDYPEWTFHKKMEMGKNAKGKPQTYAVIWIGEADDDLGAVIFILEALNGDFLKVSANVWVGDTTQKQELIFKREKD